MAKLVILRNIIDPNKDKNLLNLKHIDLKDNLLHIEGKDNCWLLKEKYYYYCQIGNSKFLPSYKYLKHLDVTTMFGTIKKGRIVIFDIQLDNCFINQNIHFYFSYMNNSIEIFPSLGYFSHIPSINNGYYANGNFILTYNNSMFKLYNN